MTYTEDNGAVTYDIKGTGARCAVFGFTVHRLNVFLVHCISV